MQSLFEKEWVPCKCLRNESLGRTHHLNTNNKREDISSGFSKQFNAKCPGLLNRINQSSQQRTDYETQPLHKEGQQILSLCKDVLHHYKDASEAGKNAHLALDIRPNDQDKRDMLEIIEKGKQLGEKIINAWVSPSVGDSPIVVDQPKITDELIAGFFERSLGHTEQNSWGKGAWGLWMALDKVVKRLQAGET